MRKSLTIFAMGCLVTLAGCSSSLVGYKYQANNTVAPGNKYIDNRTNFTGYKYLANHAAEHMIKDVLSTGDIDAACANAQAVEPVLVKNNRHFKNLQDAQVLTNALSGWCAEREAYHANIRSRIASRNQIPDGAVYEHDQEKYWYYTAGQRQLAAYNALNQWISERSYTDSRQLSLSRKVKSAPNCPELKTKDDQMVYFVGLLAGTQAVANNLRSGSRLPVPQDMLTSIEEKLSCVHDDLVWHGASALANSLKVIKADESEQKQIYNDMRNFIKEHPTSVVEFPLALYAYTAWAMGDQDQIDNALMLYNDRLTSTKVKISPYRLLDALALDMVSNIYEMDRLSLLSTTAGATSRANKSADLKEDVKTNYMYSTPVKYNKKSTVVKKASANAKKQTPKPTKKKATYQGS